MGCRSIELQFKEKKMVFIEERNKFLNSLAHKPKQKALFELVFDISYQPIRNDVSEIDTIYYSSIQAIKKNSKNDFISHYNKISKRKIFKNSTAPFIHDDFLILTLVIGVTKFEIEKEWLLDVIHRRAKSTITTTFENLLVDNYQSKANIHSLVLVFLYLLDKSKITDEQLIEAYNTMSDANNSIDDDFIRIINCRAFDIIIQFKSPRDTDEISRLLEFENRFKKRVNVLSYLIYNVLLLLLLFGVYKIMDSLPEDWKSKINDLVVILGLAGTGLIGNFIPKLRMKFRDVLLNMLGYQA